jgi:hypothetical protein
VFWAFLVGQRAVALLGVDAVTLRRALRIVS